MNIDPTILGPLLIILFGGGVSAAFYFVARSHVGGSRSHSRVGIGGEAPLNAPDASRQ